MDLIALCGFLKEKKKRVSEPKIVKRHATILLL